DLVGEFERLLALWKRCRNGSERELREVQLIAVAFALSALIVSVGRKTHSSPPLNLKRTSALLLSFIEVGFVQLGFQTGSDSGMLHSASVYRTPVVRHCFVYRKTVAPWPDVR